MGAEIAFLLGVIVGQWLMLFTFWVAAVRLIRLFGSADEGSAQQPPRGTEIIYFPRADYFDRHKS